MTIANRDPDRTTRAPSASIQLSPMKLSRGSQAALIGIRLFIFLSTAMAIFTIVHAPVH